MNKESDESANQPPEASQPEAQEQPKYRAVSQEELKQILEAHQKWVESGGKEGERADLQGANLVKANLQTAVIRRARNSPGSQVLRLASGAGIIFLLLLVETACSDGGITGESAASRAVKARADTVRGSVTLSWTPPTQNTDGSKLSDLAGYKIYYGTSEKYFQRVVEVKDPSATEYTINNLPPFRYYFAVTAYNAAGAESAPSSVQSKTVR